MGIKYIYKIEEKISSLILFQSFFVYFLNFACFHSVSLLIKTVAIENGAMYEYILRGQ
jgi:hypothetical protein